MLGASPALSLSLFLCRRVRCFDDDGARSPGRFFAANELKAMLAYIVVNYDLKIGGDGHRPENVYFGANVIPSPSGEVMFRKRQVSA